MRDKREADPIMLSALIRHALVRTHIYVLDECI
jgi:hypothetical protein